ncbi:hypothetical protein AA0120_g9422 [Alternaria tenuissima]|nr:hypothetical protein AA0120_g9422 [Alternaria tenuissima]
MVLSPGGLVQQPESREDSSQTIWAEPPTFVRVHILNAEHVRKWTGISPPQSLVDPGLYRKVCLPSASYEEFEKLARKDKTLCRQLEKFMYESDRSTILKEDNPYEAIQSRNARRPLFEDRDQNSGEESSWWRRFFKWGQ